MTEKFALIGDFEATSKLVGDDHSSLEVVELETHIALPASYLGKIKEAIAILLDEELQKYSSTLCGLPVAFNDKKVRLLSRVGTIIGAQSCVHFDVQTEFVVFKPKVGDLLQGVVTEIHSNRISCLIHTFFYASVNLININYEDINMPRITDVVIFKVVKLEDDGFGYLAIIGEYQRKVASLHDVDSGIDDEACNKSVSTNEKVQSHPPSPIFPCSDTSLINTEDGRMTARKTETDGLKSKKKKKEKKKEKKKKKKQKRERKKLLELAEDAPFMTDLMEVGTPKLDGKKDKKSKKKKKKRKHKKKKESQIQTNVVPHSVIDGIEVNNDEETRMKVDAVKDTSATATSDEVAFKQDKIKKKKGKKEKVDAMPASTGPLTPNPVTLQHESHEKETRKKEKKKKRDIKKEHDSSHKEFLVETLPGNNNMHNYDTDETYLDMGTTHNEEVSESLSTNLQVDNSTSVSDSAKNDRKKMKISISDYFPVKTEKLSSSPTSFNATDYEQQEFTTDVAVISEVKEQIVDGYAIRSSASEHGKQQNVSSQSRSNGENHLESVIDYVIANSLQMQERYQQSPTGADTKVAGDVLDLHNEEGDGKTLFDTTIPSQEVQSATVEEKRTKSSRKGEKKNSKKKKDKKKKLKKKEKKKHKKKDKLKTNEETDSIALSNSGNVSTVPVVTNVFTLATSSQVASNAKESGQYSTSTPTQHNAPTPPKSHKKKSKDNIAVKKESGDEEKEDSIEGMKAEESTQLSDTDLQIIPSSQPPNFSALLASINSEHHTTSKKKKNRKRKLNDTDSTNLPQFSTPKRIKIETPPVHENTPALDGSYIPDNSASNFDETVDSQKSATKSKKRKSKKVAKTS